MASAIARRGSAAQVKQRATRLELVTFSLEGRCPSNATLDGATTYDSDDPPSATESAILIEKWPDLAAVVTAWPDLPEPVRAGIAAMVRAAANDARH